MTGRYWEDFVAGEVIRTAGRTITEADVVTYSGLSGDFNPLHTDEVFASQTAFGRRLVHGPLVLALALGLFQRTGVTDGTAVALLGIEEWSFVAPVFIGETIFVDVEIERVRPTSHPERGVIYRRFGVHAQSSSEEPPRLVGTGRSNLMVRRRPASTTPE